MDLVKQTAHMARFAEAQAPCLWAFQHFLEASEQEETLRLLTKILQNWSNEATGNGEEGALITAAIETSVREALRQPQEDAPERECAKRLAYAVSYVVKFGNFDDDDEEVFQLAELIRGLYPLGHNEPEWKQNQIRAMPLRDRVRLYLEKGDNWYKDLPKEVSNAA